MDISLGALNRAIPDEGVKFDVLREIAGRMETELTPDSNLPAVSTGLFRLISRRTGDPDPFRAEKTECNAVALPIAKRITPEILRIRDPLDRLRTAALAAIAGNTMDLGTGGHSFDLSTFEEEYSRILTDGLAIDHAQDLLEVLERAGTVLYLADNAGEIAFDRILVKVISDLGPEVTLAVKGGPISNDATLEDAEFVGMGELTRVMTTGTDSLGINLEESSKQFLEAFDSTDLVLGKGQSNLETLLYYRERLRRPTAFVLKVKCAPIGQAMGAELGDNVVKLLQPSP
jgi:uncharacterized protein with ATP-grasp and redox domains